MPATLYRLYINDEAATQEQLDQVEQIRVEQEVDMAWEARLTIPLCTDDDGSWQGDDALLAQAFNRVRVEIQVGDGDYTALIDGPVVGYDSDRSSQPGQSSLTVIVHDDSVYLNRQEQFEPFDDKTDSEIAEALFADVDQIADTDIEDVTAAPNDLPPAFFQRGTAMNALRDLAARQHYHAYVLPGDEPGASLGCFRPFPADESDLPDLILLGADRNIESFSLSQDAQSPSRVQAFGLNITDKAVLTSSSSFRDLSLLGDEAALSEEQTAARIAAPGTGNSVDLDQQANGQAQDDSYDFSATGSVVADCYPGVLLPYQTVVVRGVSATVSGTYEIHQVTHTLNRSSYAQSFTLKRNARTTPGGGAASLLAGIF